MLDVAEEPLRDELLLRNKTNSAPAGRGRRRSSGGCINQLFLDEFASATARRNTSGGIMQIRKHPLGLTGIEITKVGFGAWAIGETAGCMDGDRKTIRHPNVPCAAPSNWVSIGSILRRSTDSDIPNKSLAAFFVLCRTRSGLSFSP